MTVSGFVPEHSLIYNRDQWLSNFHKVLCKAINLCFAICGPSVVPEANVRLNDFYASNNDRHWSHIKGKKYQNIIVLFFSLANQQVEKPFVIEPPRLPGKPDTCVYTCKPDGGCSVAFKTEQFISGASLVNHLLFRIVSVGQSARSG